MWKQLLFGIIGDIFKRATPSILSETKAALDVLEQHANNTPNPVDNMLVNLLKEIMKVGTNDDTGD